MFRTILRGATAACLAVMISTSAWAAPFTVGNLAVFSADTATSNNTAFSILELNASTANQTTPVQTISINGTSGGTALRSSGSATSTGYLATSDDRSLLTFAGVNTTTTGVNSNTIVPRGVGTLDGNGTFALATTYNGTSGQ